MKHPQQAETPSSQQSHSAPFSRRSRSVLAAALCSAGLLSAIAAIPSAYAIQMVGLTIPDGGGNQTIVSFDSATPGTVTTSPTIAGPALGVGTEILVGIDYRPANGLLYGVSNVGATFTIDPGTGAAVQVRDNTGLTIVGSDFYGLDFNPVSNQLRLTSTRTAPPAPGTSQTNRAINIEDPSLAGVAVQGELAYAVGDVNAAATPSVEASAYTNSVTGPAPASTTLYGIDTALNALVTQVPATGVLTTVGPLGVDAGNLASLDIASNGTAYAAFVTGAGTTTNLYTVNLATGAATAPAAIGAAGGPQIIGISSVPSAAPPPAAGTTVQFGAATYSVTEGTANAAITVTRTGPATGTSTVQFATSNGTAVAGSDYTATTTTVTFAPNATTQTVNVPITDDSAAEPTETVTLTLSAPNTGTTLGTQATATLNIADNDSGGTPPPPAPAPAPTDDGGGCALNPNGRDAGLLMVLLSAALVGIRRRWKK